mmetsp:Transcript_28228/g.65369  ORF Transcript_28228/g.65369 Transcript_28228/m.65369 type:complete len:84 (-) Transcript_28228:820-1071(-)
MHGRQKSLRGNRIAGEGIRVRAVDKVLRRGANKYSTLEEAVDLIGRLVGLDGIGNRTTFPPSMCGRDAASRGEVKQRHNKPLE